MKTNIWFMNHYATQMMTDKAGRHYWFAKRLKYKGHDVSVFCASTFLKSDGKIDTHNHKYEVHLVDDIPFVVVDVLKGTGNGIARVINMASFAKNLIFVAQKYAKRTGKPNVIVASSVHPLTMVAGIQIAKKFHIPCICEIRDLWPEAIFTFGKAKEKSILGKILIRGEHWIYKNADALIFTKEGDTDYLRERGWLTDQNGDIELKKCHYINNGIDIKMHENRIETERLADDELERKDRFNVVYAGIIRPMNKVDYILDCAKIIGQKDEYREIIFLIYGEGSELERLRKRVEDEKIDNVKFKGFVERKYIPYVLSKSSVNLLNYSQNEYNWSRGNSSNKLFEYMASGKPIISTVRMGYSIINRYKCGIELNECTPETLAKAVMEFYDMPKLEYEAYGRNARLGAEDFDFDVLTDKLLEVVEEVLA